MSYGYPLHCLRGILARISPGIARDLFGAPREAYSRQYPRDVFWSTWGRFFAIPGTAYDPKKVALDHPRDGFVLLRIRHIIAFICNEKALK